MYQVLSLLGLMFLSWGAAVYASFKEPLPVPALGKS